MIYPALVIDNATFYTTGTIRVRIQNYFYGTMIWDLSQNTSAVTDGYNATTKTHQDFDAYVFSPIGGGKNYGIFYLPEPNTKGFVAFTGNAVERGNSCFWMGSVFEPTMSGKTLDSINIPSDQISANGANSDGFVNGSKNSDIYDGALVIRLKSTAIKNLTAQTNPDADALNWEKNNTENLIVINKDKILIHHASTYDNSQKELTFQEINLSPDTTTITLSSKNNSSDTAKTAKLQLLNNGSFGFNLSMTDVNNKVSSSISSLDGIMIIDNTIDKNVSNISMNSSGIAISYNDASINLDTDATISTTSGNVYVVGKEIHIGQGNARVVTTSSGSGSYNFENGLILDASETIFG